MQKSVPVDKQRGGPEDGAGSSPEPMFEMGTVDDAWKTLKPERVGPKGWKGGTCLSLDTIEVPVEEWRSLLRGRRERHGSRR